MNKGEFVNLARTRRQPYQKQEFESTCLSSDVSANIYMSMLQSKAWKLLTNSQKVLYLYCKAQYYAEKKKPNGIPQCFTMNQSKWCNLYGLYKKSNAKGFYRDMDSLIEKGFIICVERGGMSFKNIYQYSNMWQKFGESEFIVLPAQKTASLLHKSAQSVASSQ